MNLRYLVLIPALWLGGCSTTQLAQFQSGLSNFPAGVQSVNQAIAQTSAALGQNCNSLQAAANDLWVLGVSVSSKVGPTLAAANSAIQAWCQAPPNDIASAIAATAAQITAAKAAYKAAQKG